MAERPSASRQKAYRRGHHGEWLAAAALMLKGYRILARRHRTRFGEIDLIARRGDLVLIVEVKARRMGAVATPLQSVPPAKQRQVRRMAAAWLVESGDRPRARELRFDAIGVTVDHLGALVRLDHLEAAF